MGAAMDEKQRPTPRALGLATSDAVEAAFQKALAVDPRDRYADIGEFWDALESEFGMATTRVWATPNLDSAPPGPPATRALGATRQNAATAVEARGMGPALSADIPDLLPATHANERAAQARSLPAAPVAAGGFDDFGDLGLAGEVVPMAGGFRLETMDDVASGAVPSANRVVQRPQSSAVARFEAARASRERPSFMGRLVVPAKILGVAVVIVLLDWTFTMTQGQALKLGPVTAIWLAGPLAAFAILKLVFVLISDH
jgi:serine/threonine-protein kinase